MKKQAILENKVEKRASAIAEFVENHLTEILDNIDLPTKHKLKSRELAERRKPREEKLSAEEFQEKIELVREIRKFRTRRPTSESDILEKTINGYNQELTSKNFLKATEMIAEDDGMLAQKEIDSPHLIDFLFPKSDATDSAREGIEFSSGEEKQIGQEKKRLGFQSLVNSLGQNLDDIELDTSDEVMTFVIDGDASEAFNIFLAALEEIDIEDINFIPMVSWTGNTDLDDSSIADYLAELMIKTDISPIVTGALDTVKAVKEGR